MIFKPLRYFSYFQLQIRVVLSKSISCLVIGALMCYDLNLMKFCTVQT